MLYTLGTYVGVHRVVFRCLVLDMNLKRITHFSSENRAHHALPFRDIYRMIK